MICPVVAWRDEVGKVGDDSNHYFGSGGIGNKGMEEFTTDKPTTRSIQYGGDQARKRAQFCFV